MNRNIAHAIKKHERVITITVRGPVKSGRSALAQTILNMLVDIDPGLQLYFDDPSDPTHDFTSERAKVIIKSLLASTGIVIQVKRKKP